MIKRLEIYDIIKGIGIIGVVLGHALNTDCFYNDRIDFFRRLIYLFNLIIFVFVSGRFINFQYDIKFFIKKKAKSLYLPYILINLILLMIQIMINMSYLNLKKIIIMILNVSLFNSQVYLSSFLWFVQVLFFSEILFFLVFKYTNKFTQIFKIIYLCVTMIVFVLVGYIFFSFNINVYNIDLIFLMIHILGVGYIFKIYQNIIDLYLKKYNIILCIGILLLMLSICYYFPWIQIELSKRIFAGNIMYFYSISILSILFVYSLAIFLTKFVLIKKYITEFGMNSYFIMGFHYLFFYCVDKLIMMTMGVDLPYKRVISFPSSRWLDVFVTFL